MPKPENFASGNFTWSSNGNERAKRQIIRKSLPYLRFHKITSRSFLELKGFDEKTLVLAKKKLDNE